MNQFASKSNAYVPVGQNNEQFTSGQQQIFNPQQSLNNPDFPRTQAQGYPVRRDFEKTIATEQGNRNSQGRNFSSNSMTGSLSFSLCLMFLLNERRKFPEL
jgi:hypothetical protein